MSIPLRNVTVGPARKLSVGTDPFERTAIQTPGRTTKRIAQDIAQATHRHQGKHAPVPEPKPSVQPGSSGLGAGSDNPVMQLVALVVDLLSAIVAALCGPNADSKSGGSSSSDSSVDSINSPSDQDFSSKTDNKMWDVFFDRKSGTSTKRQSPVVLDLNGNGKADITGSTIVGNGKLEGKAVNGFDLNPNDRQWQYKSVKRRPGKGAPALPKGTVMKVFDAQGKAVATHPAEGRTKGNLGLQPGQRAELWSKEGQLVGEFKKDAQLGRMLYHYGNVNQNEWTRAWQNGKGDGMLVWDADADGKITSGKELFGEFDTEGKKRFENGYQKLAYYFDKNKDGSVDGSELDGLKIWEDRDGDGITDEGELVALSSHDVVSFDVKNANNPNAEFSSTYGTKRS